MNNLNKILTVLGALLSAQAALANSLVVKQTISAPFYELSIVQLHIADIQSGIQSYVTSYGCQPGSKSNSLDLGWTKLRVLSTL